MGDRRFSRLSKGHDAPRHRTEDTAEPQSEVESTPIEARPFRRFDPATLPAREWLYGGHYQRGIVTATGPGGGGKSYLNLVELIAICTGRPLLGEQPVIRCKAWYHNAEDDEDEIYRRIAAVCQHYEIDQGELEGWLFVTSGISMPIKVAIARAGTVRVDKATTAAIIRTITDNEIGIASFELYKRKDTLRPMAAGGFCRGLGRRESL
jgi:AAA domain